MSRELILQAVISGLLMGLIYALVAVGLTLIFGLMEIVNFAHGEFLMLAMFTAFWFWALAGLDPVAIGLGCVGIAGTMLSTFYYIFPDVGTNFALLAFVAVALGGFGSIAGSLLAGLLIGLVESLGGLLLDPSYKTLIVFALYLAVVIFRPHGLFGRF